jgi:hypothetical protein
MSEEEEYAQKAIIGTWEEIASGQFVDDLHENTMGTVMDFLPDGVRNEYEKNAYGDPFATSQGFPDYSCREKSTYKIKKNILILKSSTCVECAEYGYKYRFSENGKKLELTKPDWKPVKKPDGWDDTPKLAILITNIIIYKKINKPINN